MSHETASAPSQDTLLRNIELLRLIQTSGYPQATSTLKEKLYEQGFRVSNRTLQRDLEKLSKLCLIECHDHEKPYRWAAPHQDNKSHSPLATTEALAFALAAPYLKRRLPTEVFQTLNAKIREAEQRLDQMQSNHVANWRNKVRSLPGGGVLKSAREAEPIWQQVSEAVLAEQQLQIRYQAHDAAPKDRIVNPLAVVVRETKSYLIATVGEYTQPALFAINRIQEASLTHRPAHIPDDFSLTELIDSGRFGWAAKGSVTLRARIRSGVAVKLKETPISDCQDMSVIDDDWYQLMATVPDNRETLWWIYSMNHNIQVLEPQHWVEEIRETLTSWMSLYPAETDAEDQRCLTSSST